MREETQKKTTFLSRIADVGDWFDRKVYGRKLKFFIYISIGTIIFPGIVGILAQGEIVSHNFHSNLSTFLTLILFIYISISILSWLSIWRNEDGNWSWKTAIPILKLTISESFKDFIFAFKGSQSQILYNLGIRILIVGISFAGISNVIFLLVDITGIALGEYKLAYWFLDWSLVILLIGLIVFIGAIATDKEELLIDRLKNDLTIKKSRTKIKLSDTSQMVVNITNKNQLEYFKSKNNDIVLNQVLECIKSWTPRTWHDENEYQISLYHKFHRDYPDLSVQMEYPLGGRRRADLVINDSLMIEMKKDFKNQNEINRASGQLEQYIDDWKEHGDGPIMLLICKDKFTNVKQPLENLISKKKVFKKDIMAVLGNDLKN